MNFLDLKMVDLLREVRREISKLKDINEVQMTPSSITFKVNQRHDLIGAVDYAIAKIEGDDWV